jgi:hypothetical protein
LGFEHDIGDMLNQAGKPHLKRVGLENNPHIPTSSILDLAWSYVRRFARDLQTGETIELY